MEGVGSVCGFFLRQHEGESNGAAYQRGDDDEGPGDREFPTKQIVQPSHLQADEHQNQTQPKLEEVELVHHPGEKKVECSQAEDGEDI